MKVEFKRINTKVGMEVSIRQELSNKEEVIVAMHVSDWDIISQDKQNEYIDELVKTLGHQVVKSYKHKIWCEACKGMRLVDVPVEGHVTGSRQQVCIKCKGQGYTIL